MIKEIKVYQNIFKKFENVEKIYNIIKFKIYLIYLSIFYIFFKIDLIKKNFMLFVIFRYKFYDEI